MFVIDNINQLLGDDPKKTVSRGSKIRIAASCFSIYAFEALRQELSQIESLQFIFTSPTFLPDEVTDQRKRERKKFHIPKARRERDFYGSEFEIELKNQLAQKAIARECAEWMWQKAIFRSNKSSAPMQQFACVEKAPSNTVCMPLLGFTAVDLGYQKGDAVSNMVNRMDEPSATAAFLSLFDQIWNDRIKFDGNHR